ncbi:hypothetical protein BDF20DRAFT_625504 [Mycotypha africana]|uniref:uncharacterized protein n=1 Tax=Mycotypha africana TaxID=64632 RepID=UPI002300A9F5|nr:uncharacterized protein BDF20DRAFT_625504 [Mycotypha africana]KAI8975695.1 hypothetical protein BDF20DRAFT_625504 [Mycotypha africana]
MAPIKLLTLTAVLSLVTSTIQTRFIQDDVLAFPRYKVVVTKDKIAQTDIDAFKGREDKELNHVIMTSSYGQPFSCVIPDVQIEQERIEREQQVAAKDETEEDRQRIIQKGLELLEPIGQTSCIKFFASTNQYWTYEYCHNRYIRQMHIERSYDGKVEKEHETASFYLGFHPGLRQGTTDIQTKQHNDKAALIAKGNGAHQHQKQYGHLYTELRTLGDQRYLVQKWKDGSICDLTERPRTVEVQYHCDLHGPDRVTSFVEVSTCNYQIMISTPRLCEELRLSERRHDEAHEIQCRPIVSEELLEEERRKETDRLLLQEATTTLEMGTSDTENSQDQVQQGEEKTDKVAKDERDTLLNLISDLTVQINQLKQQVDGSKVTANNADRSNKQVKTEITFYTMDEDGNIIQQNPSLFHDKLTLQDLIKESFEKDSLKEESEEQKTKAKNQHNNRQAYEQRYFE